MRTLSAALVSFVAAPVLLAGDPQAGRAKAKACIVRHGEMGIAIDPAAPNLAGQPHAYPGEQLKNFRSGKRENPLKCVIATSLHN